MKRVIENGITHFNNQECSMENISLDIILPVYNEADQIEVIIKKYDQIFKKKLGNSFRIIVCEDGSVDGTKDILVKLPIILNTSIKRKGYSKAIMDGLKLTQASLVALSDSDGQIDPEDLLKLYSYLILK